MKFAIGMAAAGTLAMCGSAQAGLTAWINELHYDNSGTDVGEFVEVVLHDSLDASDYTVSLYNGNGGGVYNTITVDVMTVGASVNGFTLYWWALPSNGLQNGAPDGLSLSNSGGVDEFLSYEGTMTATDGPANGMLSTDIGVTQGSGTAAGSSVGLTGTYPTFSWVNFDAGPLSGGGGATPGQVNFGQTIPAPGALALLGLAGLAGARRRRRA